MPPRFELMFSDEHYHNTLIFWHTHARAQTHTHTCTCTFIYHSQNWLRGPHSGVSQQEVTSLVVPLAAGTPALSPHPHGPSVHWGTHLWACKTHEMREVEYGLEWRHQNIHPGLLAAKFLTSTLGNCLVNSWIYIQCLKHSALSQGHVISMRTHMCTIT